MNTIVEIVEVLGMETLQEWPLQRCVTKVQAFDNLIVYIPTDCAVSVGDKIALDNYVLSRDPHLNPPSELSPLVIIAHKVSVVEEDIPISRTVQLTVVGSYIAPNNRVVNEKPISNRKTYCGTMVLHDPFGKYKRPLYGQCKYATILSEIDSCSTMHTKVALSLDASKSGAHRLDFIDTNPIIN